MILNPYQKEILQAVAEDVPIKAIADRYKRTYCAVNAQIAELRRRHNCPTNVTLVLKALESGQIENPFGNRLKKVG